MINFNQSKQRQQEKRKTGIVNEMNRENNKQQRHPSGFKQVASGRQQQQQPVGMKPNTGRQGKTMTAGMMMPSSAPATTTISKTITPPIGARMVGQELRPAVDPSNRAPDAHHPVVVGRRQQQQRFLVGQTSQQHQQQQPRRFQATAKVANSALMKKAYVRFDDYLDLNEENMRRSCKRLMNHLYSDGPEPKEPMSCCRASSSSASLKRPPRTQPPPPPPPPPTSTSTLTATGAPSGIRVAEAINNQASSSEEPSTTNGKSYLRSQYERRQLRQLELMNKMQQQQQQPMAPSKLQIADGASKCLRTQEHRRQLQQQQQDLVAQSHELSKRRFFEQLERRESIKNLNLGQQLPITATTVKGTTLLRQREASFFTDEKLANDEKGVSPTLAASAMGKQKGLGNSDDEDKENDARLKVYQSIALNNGESSDCYITNANNKKESELGHQVADMLDGGSGGAFKGLLEDEVEFGSSKELAIELIGFYTPSPQSPANNNEDDQRRLIEFSLERQLERPVDGSKVQENLYWPALNSQYNVSASGSDESAFEIKVPPPADSHHSDLIVNPLSSANTTTGSRLVVKQVEVDDDAKCLLKQQLSFVEATNVDGVGDRRKRPPTSSSKRLKSVSAPASTQHPAANKTKTKPDASKDDDLTENKVKLIEAAHHQRSGQEQKLNRAPISKSIKFERNKQKASSETMAFVKGSRKLIVVAPKSQPTGDNKQKEPAGISLTISGGKHNNNTTKMSKAISLELGATGLVSNDGAGGCCFGRPETTSQVGLKLADKLFGSTGALSSTTKTTTTTSTLTSVDAAATVASFTAIEASAANCSAWHHDGPETASAGAVGQSGGAGSEEVQSSSACLVQLENEKESTAQQVATTQQVTSLRTTITTDKTGWIAGIRDVLPGASSAKGTNSIEAIVSGCGHLSKADKGKVMEGSSGAFERQTNQVQQQLKQDEKEYANPLAANSTGDGGEHTGKNNVNHELSGDDALAATILCRRQEQANIDLLTLDGHHQHLIESSSPVKRPVLVVEKQSQSSRNGSVQEEDEGSSSCSSSGFGASVSVTSTSSIDGSQSRSPKLKTCSDDFNRSLITSCPFSATNREREKSQEVEEEEEPSGPEEPHYDRVRSVRDHQWATNQQVNQMGSPCQTLDKKTIDEGEGAGRDAFHDYKELVGPDQAYPGQYNHQNYRRHHHHYHHHHQLPEPATLFVENHNYAPLLDRSSFADPTPGNSNSNSKLDYYSTSIVLEQDSLLEGYANLPIARNKPPVLAKHIVEYATVRQQQHYHQQQMKISGSKKKEQVIENCLGGGSEVSGLSGHSYSSSGSSSSNSGGFSALPPAPRPQAESSSGEPDRPIEAEQAMGTRKRTSSLFKRFGSLVSKAFMSNVAIGAQSPATSKISESFAAPGASDVSSRLEDGQQQLQQVNNACGRTESSGPKSVLILERNDDHQQERQQQHQVAALATSEEPADAGNDNDNGLDIGDSFEVGTGANCGAGKSVSVKEKPDLVILPTKNHVNQRKQLQSADLAMVRHHDDRLSRGTRKLHSRKLKSNNSSSTSVTSLSSSFSSSSGTGSVSGGISNSHHHRGRGHHLGVRRHNHHGHKHHHRNRRHPKKPDSLFEDLESLMSPSDEDEEKEASGQLPNYHCEKENSQGLSRRRASSSGQRQRINIDCISPVGGSSKHARDKCDQSVISKSSGPRSLLRLFSPSSNVNNSRHHQQQQQQGKASAESTPNLANLKAQRRERRDTSECDINELQPISGFWGFSSLIGQNHANVAKTSNSMKQRTKLEAGKGGARDDRDSLEDSKSANLKPLEAGYELHFDNSDTTTTGRKQQQSQDVDSKHQSLNLYRNLLRNYTKRRHHRQRGHHHHHHGHHHHHHHHHHRHQLLATTNAANVAAATGSCARQHRSTRCAQSCSKNCPTKLSANNANGIASSSCSTTTHTCCSDPELLASVWGQLIKINKLDGSQVIELQRLPGKSWGFFVARGAINNVKGIFISRMHDKVTSDSLTGLLSIGDRILAIDECPIEPDYDILRVNQMISKKIKILLKVKPFKG